MSQPKKINDDCFDLPKGVKWSPVYSALEKLKTGLSIIPKENLQPVEKSIGFIISKPCYAQISNPNFSNSAVDGYGLNGKNLSEDNTFNLLPKVAYAGTNSIDTIPNNYAIRIIFSDNHSSGIYSWGLLHDFGKNHDKYLQNYYNSL